MFFDRAAGLCDEPATAVSTLEFCCAYLVPWCLPIRQPPAPNNLFSASKTHSPQFRQTAALASKIVYKQRGYQNAVDGVTE